MNDLLVEVAKMLVRMCPACHGSNRELVGRKAGANVYKTCGTCVPLRLAIRVELRMDDVSEVVDP